MKGQLFTMLLPFLVPYVTAGIKEAWGKFQVSCPIWLKPFRPLIAGWIVAAVSKAAGVALPSDLASLTDSDVMGVLTSGVFLGGMGAWLNNIATGFRLRFGPETRTGMAIRLIAGSDEPKSEGSTALHFLPWIFLAVLLFSGEARAEFSAEITGTEVSVSYREPVTNINGTPLSDLDHTSIFHNFGGARIKAIDIKATAPAGGGAISSRITIPVGENIEVLVDIWASATDASGNESPDSSHAVKRIDHLPPGAPN